MRCSSTGSRRCSKKSTSACGCGRGRLASCCTLTTLYLWPNLRTSFSKCWIAALTTLRRQFRFNTKAGKSDVVIAPAGVADRAFVLSGVDLHVSNEYKYLGVEMGRTGQGCWNSYLHRARRK